MSIPYMGEIMIVPFNFAPKGWAFCNGQLLPINQYQALFSLLGTTYGGNGQTTFALPDLRARIPIHMGNGHTLGEKAGSEFHTVNIQQLPQHTHALNGTTNAATTNTPGSGVGYARATSSTYVDPGSLVAMEPTTVVAAGGSQPHENRAPFLTVNFCIALWGVFPSQT